ncbi:MAG: hypothetical protein H0U73_02885 [Tatlockia sp.]|nr:hypothetical protein [Tatlockia sp.]
MGPLHKLFKPVFCLGFLLSSFFLSGCIDLAGSQSLAKNKDFLLKSKAQVFVMRGGLGGIFSTGMNQLQGTLERRYGIRTESTVWYKANSLSKYIIKNYGTKTLPGPIVLVGHSLGANDQIKVALDLYRKNIPVALLMTIDAVSPLQIPPNVRHVVNIYKPSFVPMFSGIRVKAIDPVHTKVENIDVATFKVAINHFTIDKKEEVQKLMIDKTLEAVSQSNKRYG